MSLQKRKQTAETLRSAYITAMLFSFWKSVHPRAPRCGHEDPDDHRHLVSRARHQRVLSTSSRPVFFFLSLSPFFSTPSRRPQLILLPRGIPEQQARPLFYLNSLPCSTRGSVDLLGLFGNIFTRDNSQVERNWISISLIKYFNQSSITNSDSIITRDWKERILENL